MTEETAKETTKERGKAGVRRMTESVLPPIALDYTAPPHCTQATSRRRTVVTVGAAAKE